MASDLEPAGTAAGRSVPGARLAGLRWWIPVLYLLVGIAWILLSDRMVDAIFAETAVRNLQSLKGIAFVIVTAGGLWLLLRHHAAGIVRAHRAELEHARRYRQLLDLHPDPAWLYEAVGPRLLYVNPAARTFFALGDGDVASLDAAALQALMPGPGDTPPAVSLHRIRRPDGRVRDVELHTAPVGCARGGTRWAGLRDRSAESEAERMRDELAEGNRQLQAVAARVFTLQEDERRAISRELHDEIGQAITAIKMSASAARHEADAQRRSDDIDDILVLADATIERVRDISILLRPPQLDALGLEAALRWHAERLFRNATPALSLEIEHLPERPDREIEQACFRIAQEALTNALRHAGAGAVSLRLNGDDGHLRLRIEDDGGGFDPVAGAGGLGILIMRERAQGVGGDVSVVSAPGDGTRVDARLPPRAESIVALRAADERMPSSGG